MVKLINTVVGITNRQYGKYYESSYDNALQRLMVRPWDNWRGINPSGVGDFNQDPPIFAAKFANSDNYNHILAIANEDGRIALQNTFVKKTISEDLSLEGDQCHFNAVFDIAWMPHHLKLVSASGDHTARLWDVSTSKLTSIKEFCGHSRSVKVATFPRNNCNMFATGGRDGTIILWDTRTDIENEVIQKVENKIHSAHIGGGPSTPSSCRRRGTRSATPKLATNNASNSSVTGLVFQDEYTLISCGAGDGIIKAWDLRRCYSTLKKEPIAKYNLPYAGSTTLKGYTNLIVDDSGSRLYASCMDSNIYCYNINTFSKDPIKIFTGAHIKSFYIKSCLSPDNKYLLSGSSDERAYIWNVERNSFPLVSLVGHSYEVTSVAWANHQNNLDGGNMCLVTCSDDACHKIWRIGPEELPEDEKMFLRGNAELNPTYYPTYLQNKNFPVTKHSFKSLESTPRSLRRIIEQSETTPTTTLSSLVKDSNQNSMKSITSTGRKRSFQEACNGDENDADETIRNDSKRMNLETRGRRLFSPGCEPSTSCAYDLDIHFIDGGCSTSSRSLTTILEELDSPGSKNFQNHSPSPVKRQLNIIRSPEPSRKFASPLQYKERNLSLLNSPTTNLPNYVLNPQEAPHLTNLTSPQRKQKKENVDWLTKMRKQKLLTLGSGNALEKSSNFLNQSPTSQNIDNSSENVEKLKSIENKSDAHDVVKKNVHKKNETTILKFFSVKSTKFSSENA